MSDIRCRGLAVSSVLAYLAALGLLRTVVSRIPGARLSWAWRAWWIPTLHTPNDLDEEGLLDLLEQEFQVGNELPHWPKKFEIGGRIDEFRALAQVVAQQALPEDRSVADWWSAYGHETVSKKDDQGEVGFPPWILPHGQGGQYFLRSVRAVQYKDKKVLATRQRLREALFMPWGYQARTHSLPSTKWDPIDTQVHAVSACNPNDNDEKPCMPGANRLAIEALPLLVAVPTRDGLASPAYLDAYRLRASDDSPAKAMVESTDVVGLFFLPIWDGKLGIDTVRSLLVHQRICSVGNGSREELQQLGLQHRLVSRRMKDGKYNRTTSPSSCF